MPAMLSAPCLECARALPSHSPTCSVPSRLSSDETSNVPYTVDAEGFALVGGARVFGASHTKPVKAKTSCDVQCHGCGRATVSVPLVLMQRFETAIGFGRDFYWFSLGPSLPEINAMRCAECQRKAAK